jgi:nitrogen-specific signal transduction histidine kinase
VRKSFFITAFLIAAALGSLLFLAFNQFQLYGRHEEIISRTEKLIFQYSTIREQIIEDIVTGRLDQLAGISSAVEELHNNIIKILDNRLIPAEYKFSFMQQIDLPGLILLLRRTAAEKEDPNLIRLINAETRIIGERFTLLERLILGYAKQKLVDFQMVIIGTLALVVFLVTTLMVITYRFLILPVINISDQSEQVRQGRQDRIYKPGGWQEVENLSDKMNGLLHDMKQARASAERYEALVSCARYVVWKMQPVKGPEELFQTACRSLLHNPDFILAWVGVRDAEGEGITPVAADGSSTMTGEECQECFGALLAAQEGESDPIAKALQSGEIFIRRDILAKAPKGPFKNTPLASGKVDSISVPIAIENKVYGVLTVYVMARQGDIEEESQLLCEVAGLMAAKIRLFDIRNKFELEKTVKNLIGEKSNILVFVLNREGKIVSAETFLSDSELAAAAGKWIGASVDEIVRPESESERVVLMNCLARADRYDFQAGLAGFDGTFSAILAPTELFPADDVHLLLVLLPPQKNILIQPENFQVAYSAAIGQFASTIAHEITDVSNGIINYAQMLCDEIGGEAQSERRKHLNRIIAGGEKVAAVVEPLLVDPQDMEYSKDSDLVRKIFDDVFMLAGHHLRRDGIKVKLDVQPASLQYRRHHLQLLLLTLLNHLREVLNRYYPQKDPAKVLDFTVLGAEEGQGEMIRISVMLTGSESDYGRESASPEHPAGLWLTRELARNLGGEMNFAPAGADRIRVELILPV